MGVIGSRSGALRIARLASQKIFIIGLLEGASPGFYGKPINMGNTEGIYWLNEGDVINEEMLDIPHLIKNTNPSVAEIINNII